MKMRYGAASLMHRAFDYRVRMAVQELGFGQLPIAWSRYLMRAGVIHGAWHKLHMHLVLGCTKKPQVLGFIEKMPSANILSIALMDSFPSFRKPNLR